MTYIFAMYHPFWVRYDGQRPWLYIVCMLPVGVYFDAVIYQVDNFGLSIFQGRLCPFFGRSLVPFFSVVSGRGNLIVCGPDIGLMSVLPQDLAWVPR